MRCRRGIRCSRRLRSTRSCRTLSAFVQSASTRWPPGCRLWSAADNHACSSPSPRVERNSPDGLLPRARPPTSSRARSISWSSTTMARPRSQRAPREQGQPSVDSTQENWVRFASLAPNALARAREHEP
jgi:hypothetical protein